MVQDDRGQPQRRFIDHEQPRLSHQSPADGQHLLFSPAEQTGLHLSPFPQDGKQAHDPFDSLSFGAPGVSRVSPQKKVFPDRHKRKEPSSFRNLNDSFGNHFVGRQPRNRLSQKRDGPGNGFHHPLNGVEKRAFPGAVGTQKGHEFILPEPAGSRRAKPE